MNNRLKVVVAFSVLITIGIFIYTQMKISEYTSQFSSTQSLGEQQKLGQVSAQGFEAWCQEQGHQGEALTRCVQKRAVRIQLLLAHQKCAEEGINEDELTQCAYQRVCTAQGHIGDSLEECVRSAITQQNK